MSEINYLERPALVSLEYPETGEMKRVLEGKRAVVTGGGKGIGKGISIRLAEAGAEVVIVGNSNMAMAEETAALIGSRGGQAYPFGIDLSKPESAAKVVGDVHRRGFVGVLDKVDFAYATSKGGVGMLTRETAAAFRPYGVTCNTILPGGTNIEFKTENPDMGKLHTIRTVRINRGRDFVAPGYRYGFPSDTGNLAVFLCSRLGEHYNGCAIRADGGMVLF